MKNLKKIICLLVSISMCLSIFAVNTTAFEVNTELLSETEQVQSIIDNAAVEWKLECSYPVVPGDGNWEKLSYSQQLKVSNIPDEMLSELSTNELAALVLSYPFLIDVVVFDNAEQAIGHLSYTSNICKEFFSRNDSVDILLEKYSDLHVNYNMLARGNLLDSDDVVKDSGYVKELFLQTYFANKINTLTNEQSNNLQAIMAERQTEKMGVYDEYSVQFPAKYPDFFSNDITNEASDIIETAYATSGFRKTNNNLVGHFSIKCEEGEYTLYGVTEENVFKYYSGDDNPDKLQDKDYSFAKAHSSWTEIHPSTYKYNCHSYAWINASPYNIYWLSYPYKFPTSSYFSYINTNGSANSGDRIILKDRNGTPVHSVIVSAYGGGINTIKTTSKFGAYGVYDAPLSDVMIYYTQYSGGYYETYR